MDTQSGLSKTGARLAHKGALAKAIRSLFLPAFLVASFASASEAQQRTFVSGIWKRRKPVQPHCPVPYLWPGNLSDQLRRRGNGAGFGRLRPGHHHEVNIANCAARRPRGDIRLFGDGIDINAGTGDRIVLSGLTFHGANVGTNAINVTQVGSVYVERCSIAEETI
jgi:hypothetical protein